MEAAVTEVTALLPHVASHAAKMDKIVSRRKYHELRQLRWSLRGWELGLHASVTSYGNHGDATSWSALIVDRRGCLWANNERVGFKRLGSTTEVIDGAVRAYGGPAVAGRLRECLET